MYKNSWKHNNNWHENYETSMRTLKGTEMFCTFGIFKAAALCKSKWWTVKTIQSLCPTWVSKLLKGCSHWHSLKIVCGLWESMCWCDIIVNEIYRWRNKSEKACMTDKSQNTQPWKLPHQRKIILLLNYAFLNRECII